MTAEKEKEPRAGLTLAYLTSNLTPSFAPVAFPLTLPLSVTILRALEIEERGEIAKLKLYLPIYASYSVRRNDFS